MEALGTHQAVPGKHDIDGIEAKENVPLRALSSLNVVYFFISNRGIVLGKFGIVQDVGEASKINR